MIKVEVWQLAIAVVVVLLLMRRCLIVGRMQAWVLCLNTIPTVAKRYAEGDDSPLEPHEQDVAQSLGMVLDDLVNGYAKAQADEAAETVIRR